MDLSRREMLAGGAAMLLAGAAPLRAGTSGESDAPILRAALFGLHPGLLRYARPAAIEAAIERFDATVRGSTNLGERFVALVRVAGLVRCGHTHVNFANQSRAVAQAMFGARTRLPFRFRWIGREMIVTDGQRSGLARGTSILSVNGVEVRTILAALMLLARADGGNDGKRRRLLSVEGEHRVEAFDIFHPLLFPFADERATLAARTPQGLVRALRLDCVDLAERLSWLTATEVARDANPGWTLEHHGPAAIMTMPGWAMYNSSWDWRAWIADAFEQLARRGSRALILNLRTNEGGNDCGDEILAHMIDAPFEGEPFERRVRYRRAPSALVPHLDTWDRSFDTLGEAAEDIGGGFYRLPAGSADRRIVPKTPRFRGRFIVLTGPQNSSATFQFADLVKTRRLGTLVGETTGGNRRGINGGAYYFVRLPQSGLEIDLPLIGYFPATPQPDAGVEPDLTVAETAVDIANGRDQVITQALRVASNN